MPELKENKEQLMAEVKGRFARHLEENDYRKTPERFAILEEIYRRNDHFDAEGLYIHMKANNYRVSRATVYNTLELLVSCDLIKRHKFGKNIAQYEKSFGFKQHDHLICNDCGDVIEFCDPRVQQIKDTMGELLSFEVEKHSLYLYGKCQGHCDRQEKNQNA